MKQDYRHAFALGLERGLYSLPEAEGSCVVFNAVPVPDFDATRKSALFCEQGFRPGFLALEKSGYKVEAQLQPVNLECAIVFAGRNRRINELNIARAWNAIQPGGQVIFAGDKTAGIASLRKWVSTNTEVIDSFSKHHAMVFWVTKSGDNWLVPEIAKQSGGYRVSEGMFSADGPDAGSRLLVEHFDKRVGGRVADFGTGWGYLSAELLKRSDNVQSLDLYEADWHSLEAAKQNMPDTSAGVRFHWCDLTSEYQKQVLDWVIMNPPFHSGRAAEPALGQKFIQIAASTLPSGGRLLMVANRNLPYEAVLEKTFRSFETLETRDGFKVIEARK